MDMMDKILYKYQNGNTTVTILQDGTKIREYEDTPFPIQPESLDIKISNACDLNCPYCHEMSTINGKHADLDVLMTVLSCLQSGTELALGGGNPLQHPDLVKFLQWCKSKGFIANITVNQKHLSRYRNLLEYLIKDDLIKGLGISIVNNNYEDIKYLQTLTNNIVFHVITGVNLLSVIDELIQLKYCKLLVLGYKQFGRGVTYYNDNIDNTIKHWKSNLKSYIGKCILSFDNLAIEQLEIKKWFTEAGWKKFYMGDDFTFTMYIDAVERMYAPTSRSKDRKGFYEIDLLEYFKNRNNEIS